MAKKKMSNVVLTFFLSPNIILCFDHLLWFPLLFLSLKILLTRSCEATNIQFTNFGMNAHSFKLPSI